MRDSRVKRIGQDGFLLNIAKENLGKKRIVYLNSEMGGTRSGTVYCCLVMYPSPPGMTNDWSPISRQLRPRPISVDGSDTIWIGRLLEIAEDFSRIAIPIAAIHEKLGQGNAFIAIQKADGKRSAEVLIQQGEAASYLSLDWIRTRS